MVSFCSRTANIAPEDEDPRLQGEVRTDGVEQAEAKMRALGEVYGSVVDASDRKQLAAWVNRAADTMGGIDIVMNNAGVDRLPGDGFDEAVKRREPPILGCRREVNHVRDRSPQRVLPPLLRR